MQTVLIDREPVELYKILKFEGIAASGAEAKLIIADGLVSVNAQIETRKRRKMYAGDILGIGEHELRLVLDTSGATD